jgi:hypothetical protein
MPILTTLLIKAIKIAASSGNSGAAGQAGVSSLGESGENTPWSPENMGVTDSSSLDMSDAADSDSIGDIVSNIIDFLF